MEKLTFLPILERYVGVRQAKKEKKRGRGAAAMGEGPPGRDYSCVFSGSVYMCVYYDLSLCHCRANMIDLNETYWHGGDLGVRPTVFNYALPLAGYMMLGKLTHLSEPLLSVLKVEMDVLMGSVRFGCSRVRDTVTHASWEQAPC